KLAISIGRNFFRHKMIAHKCTDGGRRGISSGHSSDDPSNALCYPGSITVRSSRIIHRPLQLVSLASNSMGSTHRPSKLNIRGPAIGMFLCDPGGLLK